MKPLPQGFALLALLLSAASCHNNDDASVIPAVAQFTQSRLNFSENGGQHEVFISLNIPAGTDGQIVLSASTLTNSCFITEPALENGQIKLPVKKGQAIVNFNLSPVDNAVLDGSRIIKLSIASVSSGLRKGGTGELVVSVDDDESPVVAGFESGSLNVRENDVAGGWIGVAFASPAPADGLLVFQVDTQSKYGVDYATDPAVVNGKIFLQVAKGAASATVKIYPVNNNTFSADRNIGLELVDASGGLRIGDNTTSWCTITDDDGQTIASISSVRSMMSADGVLLRDIRVEGIVTSISNISNGRIVIEDVSGALQVQLQVTNNLTRGDVILVNLDRGILHYQQGILEVKDVMQFEKLGEESLRIVKYSLNDLLRTDGSIQSKTIQLSGVSFTQADGNITFLGDRTVSDGVSTIIVRTVSMANFSSEAVPVGLLNVTGIFVNVDGQNYLYPQDITDIRKGGLMIRRDDI